MAGFNPPLASDQRTPRETQPTREKGDTAMNPSASQPIPPAIEDRIVAQIDQEMQELVLSTEEEEQGYFFSRYRELIAAA